MFIFYTELLHLVTFYIKQTRELLNSINAQKLINNIRRNLIVTRNTGSNIASDSLIIYHSYHTAIIISIGAYSVDPDQKQSNLHLIDAKNLLRLSFKSDLWYSSNRELKYSLNSATFLFTTRCESLVSNSFCKYWSDILANLLFAIIFCILFYIYIVSF